MKKTIMTSIVGLLIVLGLVGNTVVDQKGLHAESIKDEHKENTSDKKDTTAKDVETSKKNLEKKEAKTKRFKKVEKPAKKATKNTRTKAASKSKKKITMEATAYTANCTGCSGITRTGINLKANPNQKVIAVDPNVIPLGTRVYVEGYGTAIAGDTGGDIKGNRIDVFIPNRQDALNFGRRQVTVTVLG
nr:3D domain-containing protein [Pontibacillus sp. HMF3514]